MKLVLSAICTAVLAVIAAAALLPYSMLFLPLAPEAFMATAMALWALGFGVVRYFQTLRLSQRMLMSTDEDVHDVDSQLSTTAYHLHERLLKPTEGQDIAEYAVMLAVILIIVIGTVNLIGKRANNIFSQVGHAMEDTGQNNNQ